MKIGKKNKINLVSVFMYFRYQLLVYVLGRPVTCNRNTGHIDFSIIKTIDPICQYSKGPSMQQPVAIAVDHDSARVRYQKIIYKVICISLKTLYLSFLGVCFRYRKLSHKSA